MKQLVKRRCRPMWNLDHWSVEVGKREARERLAAIPYETVTSHPFLQMVAGFE